MSWTPAKIKSELTEIGLTLTEVAGRASLNFKTVSGTVTGRQKSPSADRFISELLGVPAWVIWSDRYDEGQVPSDSRFPEYNETPVKPMTDEQLKILEEASSSFPERRRSWSRAKIEREILNKGFDDIRSVEKHGGLPIGSISQAANRKSVKVDHFIARLINAPVEQIFPHRYWIGGDEIPKHFNIENASDAQFDKWKREIGSSAMKRVTSGRRINDDGTVNHDFYNDEPAPDVSPYADGRSTVVTLPVGMIIDV